MPSMRTRLRTAAQAALAGLATTGARVYVSRLDPVPDAQLPALKIETNAEASETLDAAESLCLREMDLLVIGLAKATTGLDDVLDQIGLEVEAALAIDPTLGGLAQTVEYRGARIGFTPDLERPAAEIRLAFAVRYLVSPANLTIPA